MPDSVHLTITTLKICDRHRNVSLTEIEMERSRPGKRSATRHVAGLDFYLRTQFNNPVGRDLELVRGAQGVTLQH